MELKDSSKTRISYQQRQDIEKERQRLLQLQQQPDLGSQKEYEAKKEHESLSDSSTTVSSFYRSQDSKSLPLGEYEAETNQLLDPKMSVLPSKETSKTVQDKLNEANKRIEGLEAKVRRLSEPFDAKANLPTMFEDIPLVARIDPIKKVIISIWIENATSIKV